MKTFDSTFQQDLAPWYNSRLVQTFLQANKTKVCNWSGNSPDLNLIENLWHIFKNRLAKMNCMTMEQMIISAIQVWFHDDDVKNMCATLTLERYPLKILHE